MKEFITLFMKILSLKNKDSQRNLMKFQDGIKLSKNKRAIIEIFVDKYLDYYFQNYENTK